MKASATVRALHDLAGCFLDDSVSSSIAIAYSRFAGEMP
jgi:hypothetical protein